MSKILSTYCRRRYFSSQAPLTEPAKNSRNTATNDIHDPVNEASIKTVPTEVQNPANEASLKTIKFETSEKTFPTVEVKNPVNPYGIKLLPDFVREKLFKESPKKGSVKLRKEALDGLKTCGYEKSESNRNLKFTRP